MDILTLHGTEQKLYDLVCPLVMNPAVLRQNNNYPFKTSPKYIWFVAVNGNQTIGFLPIKKKDTHNYIIDNYYIKGDEATVMTALLTNAITYLLKKDIQLWATVHKRHSATFCEQGFRTHVEWSKYDRMLYAPKNKTVCAD